MARSVKPGEVRTSSSSVGKCFVYVMPCAYENILKLGFSRDPMTRLQALHRRYYEFFDLERALLIETETVRDARKLELTLGRSIEAHGAPAPLVIRSEAGGHTEWYRGALDSLSRAVLELRSRGFVVHAPAATWMRSSLIERNDALFSWASQMLQAIEWAWQDGCATAVLERTLRDALDAYPALAIDLESMLPAAVLEWHQSTG